MAEEVKDGETITDQEAEEAPQVYAQCRRG